MFAGNQRGGMRNKPHFRETILDDRAYIVHQPCGSLQGFRAAVLISGYDLCVLDSAAYEDVKVPRAVEVEEDREGADGGGGDFGGARGR